jgi:hypothetical protein
MRIVIPALMTFVEFLGITLVTVDGAISAPPAFEH